MIPHPAGNMNIKRITLIVVIILAVAASAPLTGALGLDYKPMIDNAGIFSDDSEDYVEQCNELLFGTFGGAIFVVTDAEYPGGDELPEDYANRVYKELRGGISGVKTDAFLYVAVDTSQVYLISESGVVPNPESYLEVNFLEYYRNKDYDYAIQRLSSELVKTFDWLSPPPITAKKSNLNLAQKFEEIDLVYKLGLLLAAVILLLILVSVKRRNNYLISPYYYSETRKPSWTSFFPIVYRFGKYYSYTQPSKKKKTELGDNTSRFGPPPKGRK
ncbi:MAG: TPM domain-containing protein [Oscillospiraceae bacterium]|jgi:uncharacterized membrane protein YgcG|nr:TPM domain-containing protein [Oscillospiraceae bacterium]